MAPGASKEKMTPGRQRRAKEDQYFDVGKVGRRTGVTLPDKGVRDEYGLEPISGIFSSPLSPRRNADKTLTSSGTQMQGGPSQHVDQTVLSRAKTPKLPPPRASTPKHTNIGSPKRMSTGKRTISTPAEDAPDPPPSRDLATTQPPANRKLDFAQNSVRRSIEGVSPFRPKRTLRRSTGGARRDPFASPVKIAVDVAPQHVPDNVSPAQSEEQQIEAVQSLYDGPIMLEDDDDGYNHANEEHQRDSGVGIEKLSANLDPETPLTLPPGSSHKADDAVSNSRIFPTSAERRKGSSKKRGRASMEGGEVIGDISVSQVSMDGAGSVQKLKLSKPQHSRKVSVRKDDLSQTIDPSLLAYDGEYAAEAGEEHDDRGETSLQPSESSPQAPLQKKPKGKARQRNAPKERDANRAMRAPGTPVALKDVLSRSSHSPCKRSGSRGASVGPVSNVNLRAATPFEDAHGVQSRAGRFIIPPLKYWANESRIWRNGAVEGVVRAEEVEKPKRKKAKKRRRKAKGDAASLDDIEEESEAESVMPDEWEEKMGVIAGEVASWDAEAQAGNVHDLVREDLAFAASSLITHDVANSEFRYAKIVTLPFFGAGVVELPPEGFKRAKNSRKMQMVFFVHEGKVIVTVGRQDAEDENRFAISRGGCWVVPRGNNYAITNESRTTTARVFFAQGCEVDSSSQKSSE